MPNSCQSLPTGAGRLGPSVAVAVVLTLGLASMAPAEEAETAPEPPPIVQRSIEHHGGELYRSSEASLELCSGSGCYRMNVLTDGGRYRHEVTGPYRGRTRRVVADNDSVSVERDGEPLVVLEQARQALRDWAMARIYFAFLPYRLADPSVRHEDLGLEEWRGRTLHRVKVTFDPGSSSDADDEYLYWFDPGSARLEQFAYSFTGNPGGLRFRQLDNYRRVGGILFFDQINLGVEGPGLSVDRIDPTFVDERMEEVSRVVLREVSVRALAAE